MPLNRDFVGREYPADAAYEVSTEVIRQFAQALGETNPACYDAAAAAALGYPGVVAPPTFLTVLSHRFAQASPLVDPQLGLDYSLVVHGEQRFEAHRPVVAGDVLSATSRVADVRAAGRNEMITLVTEVADSQGARVATLTATLVSRGTATGERS